uniref:VWFA domain-containing protein n=1 Tax=Parascaris univalens TaxID=6257 RepID=A0A915CB59_PARUN
MANKANDRNGTYANWAFRSYYSPRALRNIQDYGAYATATQDRYGSVSSDERSLLNFDGRRRRGKKFICIGLSVLLVLILAAIGITLGVVLWKKSDKAETTERPNVTPRMTFAFNVAHYKASRRKRDADSSSEDRSKTFDIIAGVMREYADMELEFRFYAVASKGRSRHSEYFTFGIALEALKEWSAINDEANPDLSGALAAVHESTGGDPQDLSYVLFPPLPEDYSSTDIFDADMKASANEAKIFFEGISAGVIVTGNETINYFVDVVDDAHIINADGLNSSQIADDITSNIPLLTTVKSTAATSTIIPNDSATTMSDGILSQTSTAPTTVVGITTAAETAVSETTVSTSPHTTALSTTISQEVNSTATSPRTTEAAVTTTGSGENSTLLTSVSDLSTTEKTTTFETESSPSSATSTSFVPPTSQNASAEFTSSATLASMASTSSTMTVTSKLTTLVPSDSTSAPVTTAPFTTVPPTDMPISASSTSVTQYITSTSKTTEITTPPTTQQWTTSGATTSLSSSEKPVISSVTTESISSTKLLTTSETSPPTTALLTTSMTATTTTLSYPQCNIAANNIFTFVIFDITEIAQSSIETWQCEITMNIARDQLQLSESGPASICINGVAWNATDSVTIDKTSEGVESRINALSANAHLYQYNSEFNVGKALLQYSENFDSDNIADSLAIVVIYATSNITDIDDAVRSATSIRQSGHHILIIASNETLVKQAADVAGDGSNVEIIGDTIVPIISWLHNKVCMFISKWASKTSSTWTTTSPLPTTTMSWPPATSEQTSASSWISSSSLSTARTAQIITTVVSDSTAMTTTSLAPTTETKSTTTSSLNCNISAHSVYASVIFDITEIGVQTASTWQEEITTAIAKEQLHLQVDGKTRMSINGVAYNATNTSAFLSSLEDVERHISELLVAASGYEYNEEFNVDTALQTYQEMFGGSTPSDIVPVVMIYANSTFTDVPQAKQTADKLRQLGHHIFIVAASSEIKDDVVGVADDESRVAIFVSDVHTVVAWFEEETCKIIWYRETTTSPTTGATSSVSSAQPITSTVAALTSAMDSTTTTTATTATTHSSTSSVTITRTLSTTLATSTQRPSTTTTSYIHRPCDVSVNKIYTSIFLDITWLGEMGTWQSGAAKAIAEKLGPHEGCTRVSVNGFAYTTTPNNITYESSLTAVESDIASIWKTAGDHQNNFEFNAAIALETYQKGIAENLPDNAIPIIVMFATQAFSDVEEAAIVANSLRSHGHHVLVVANEESVRTKNVIVADDDSSAVLFDSGAESVVEWFDEKACKFVNTAPNVGHCQMKARTSTS